jgi:hypothetical protein
MTTRISLAVAYVRFGIGLVITTNEAMRAERREFSRGAKIRFTVSPTLQAIVHVKTG